VPAREADAALDRADEAPLLLLVMEPIVQIGTIRSRERIFSASR
jgi:hypothetical protein